MDDIKIVIGSWGSYNACNERALGSKWLRLRDYNSWEDIEEELEKEGFELEGLDEELFIQDIEGLEDSSTNWDHISPQKLFEALDASGVFFDDSKKKYLDAYLEVRSLQNFFDLVDKYGDAWDSDIILYEGYDWTDLGRELFREYYNVPEELENVIDDYFDFEAYGSSFRYDTIEEYSEGLIDIR